MFTINRAFFLSLMTLMMAVTVPAANAAVGLDRTRLIINGDQKSETLTVTNHNKEAPYLAQSWVEDASGKKLENEFIALPPLQRIEPNSKGQIKVQVMGKDSHAQDRESLYYFNVREIPPKSKKPNTLQIALQTRIKMFYRPAGLKLASGDVPQTALTLTREGDRYRITNPTGYYVTIVNMSSTTQGNSNEFKSVMVAPKSSELAEVSAASLGTKPVLTYINDWGGRPKLIFSCSGNACKVTDKKAG
ncbi:fimbria/pilus periplasmic chaperone [Pantoea allii]|uniref:fimbria/pilus periplasmic chaperone n=1 Tax=Pantoea allii TaxID=574096 RepID=UPI003D31C1AD